MTSGPIKRRTRDLSASGEEPLRPVRADEDAATVVVWVPWWVSTLSAHWPLLALGAVIVPLLMAPFLFTAPKQYVAEALIAPTRARTQVQFEPSIKTVADGSSPQGTGAFTPERRQALVDLIRSSAVERQVVEQLSSTGQYPGLRTGELVQQISGGLRPRSEILSIQAVADDQTRAVAIVNAWAHGYVDQVNALYAPGESSAPLDNLVGQARSDLQQAQEALSTSLKDSRLDSLNRQIQDKEREIALLQTPYQAPATSSQQDPKSQQTGQSGQAAQQTQQSNLVAGAAAAESLNDYRLAERRTLDDLAQTLRRLDATRENVRALLVQSDPSDQSGADSAAAIALIKAQLVAVSGSLPSQLQIQLPAGGTTSDDQLRALVASIEQARAQVATEFDTRRTAYETRRTAQLAQLESDIRLLRWQQEQESATRSELTRKRDLAQQTFDALARKAEENRVSQGAGGHEVELASEASFASTVQRPTIPTLAGGAVLGFILGIVFVLGRAVRMASPGHTAREQGSRVEEMAHEQRRMQGAARTY